MAVVALVKAMAVAATKAAMAVAGRVAATEVAAVTAVEMAEEVRGGKDREDWPSQPHSGSV